MTEPTRRGVTRGYVAGLIAAVAVLAVALVVMSWGGISFFSGRSPVETPGVWVLAAEAIVFLALVMLCWGLWLQALVLLRGRRTPPWAHTLVLGAGAYLLWCFGGILAGLSIDETWLSPYALVLVVAWILCSLAFWAVLARRVYTDKPVPQWPWERRGEEGPDWVRPEDLGGPDPRDDSGGSR